nr:unnamed protein product [Digitaria exilis]
MSLWATAARSRRPCLLLHCAAREGVVRPRGSPAQGVKEEPRRSSKAKSSSNNVKSSNSRTKSSNNTTKSRTMDVQSSSPIAKLSSPCAALGLMLASLSLSIKPPSSTMQLVDAPRLAVGAFALHPPLTCPSLSPPAPPLGSSLPALLHRHHPTVLW